MPSIYILAGGTRGDVQPAVALGQGLLKAGFRVVLAAGDENHEFAARLGMDWIGLSSFRASMDDESVRQAFQSGDTERLFAALEAINAQNGPSDVAKLATEMSQDANIAAVITMTQHCALASFLGQRFHTVAVSLLPTPSYPSSSVAPPLIDTANTPLQKAQFREEQAKLMEMIAGMCAKPLAAKLTAAGCPRDFHPRH